MVKVNIQSMRDDCAEGMLAQGKQSLFGLVVADGVDDIMNQLAQFSTYFLVFEFGRLFIQTCAGLFGRFGNGTFEIAPQMPDTALVLHPVQSAFEIGG